MAYSADALKELADRISVGMSRSSEVAALSSAPARVYVSLIAEPRVKGEAPAYTTDLGATIWAYISRSQLSRKRVWMLTSAILLSVKSVEDELSIKRVYVNPIAEDPGETVKGPPDRLSTLVVDISQIARLLDEDSEAVLRARQWENLPLGEGAFFIWRADIPA